jgi:hypothetical protein
MVVLCDPLTDFPLTAQSHRDLVARSRSYSQSSLVLLARIYVAYSSIELSPAKPSWQRTEISVHTNRRVKVHDRVTFPKTLDMGPFVDVDSTDDGAPSTRAEYHGRADMATSPFSEGCTFGNMPRRQISAGSSAQRLLGLKVR